MTLQVVLGGVDDPRLFGFIYTFQCRAESPAFAKPDFNKNQRLPVLHNQIYFTTPAMIIPCDEPHPLFLQKPADLLFYLFALIPG
jgi:hypothetical protein